MLAVPFSLIPVEPVVPLWPGWIARRHVNLVTAPGGTSKGLFVVDIAARVTTGRPWPGENDGTPLREPQAVVIIAPEDDPNESLAPRLAAAGADSSLVYNLTELSDGSPFILPDSIPELRAALAEIRQTGTEVGLVILDPLSALVERSIASNIGARRVLAPLEKLARDEDIAVILTHHTVKSGSTAASKGITDAVRIALRITRPDKTSDARVLSYEKTNIASGTSTLRYVVVEDGLDTRIAYPGTSGAPASLRSYKISEPVQVPAGGRDYQVYYGVKGSVRRMGSESYPDSVTAKKAAEDHAGHPLTWKPGDSGSSYAAVVVKGKPLAYTVWSDTAA
jgi:AAA domain